MIFLAAGFGLLLLWWAADLSDQTGKEVWVVESTGDLSFTATGDRTVLTGIGLCMDDADAFAEGTESVPITGTVHILDSDRLVVWETGFTDLEVPVLQIEEMDGLMSETLELIRGETYTFICYDSSSHEMTGLTWSFYGEERNVGGFFAIVCIAVMLMLSFLYWAFLPEVSHMQRASRRREALRAESDRKDISGRRSPRTMSFRPAVLLTILLGGSAVKIVLAFFSLPDEMTEIKEAYALSNRILEQLSVAEELCDQIPSGVMRLSDHADVQSMLLFWTNGDYGNTSLPWAEEFVSSASGLDLRSFIPALCLSLIRVLGLPYQWYLILPRLANALFFTAMLMLAIRLCPAMQRFLGAFALLPSVLLFMNSFSRKIWDVIALMLFVCLCVQVGNGGRAAADDSGDRIAAGEHPKPPSRKRSGTIYSEFSGTNRNALPRSNDEREFSDILAGEQTQTDNVIRRICLLLAVVVAAVFLPMVLTGNFAAVETTEEVAEWMASFPFLTLLMYIRTLLYNGDLLLGIFAGPYGLPACSALLVAGSFLGFLTTAMGKGKKSGGGARWAVYGLIFGVIAVMTSAMLVETDTEYLWNYIGMEGLQSVDFLPLLLLVPFALPSAEWAGRHADKVQIWQPVLSVLCMLTWFGGVLHGIG